MVPARGSLANTELLTDLAAYRCLRSNLPSGLVSGSMTFATVGHKLRDGGSRRHHHDWRGAVQNNVSLIPRFRLPKVDEVDVPFSFAIPSWVLAVEFFTEMYLELTVPMPAGLDSRLQVSIWIRIMRALPCSGGKWERKSLPCQMIHATCSVTLAMRDATSSASGISIRQISRAPGHHVVSADRSLLPHPRIEGRTP
jgi:hypothetical protein